MTAEQDGHPAEVDQAFAGAPQRVGWFRFYFEDQRWEWSEQVQRMHGYEPGTVTPTTELVLAHKHPEDRREVAKTIDEMLLARRAFSTRHRIVDTHGVVHQVVVVADLLTDRHDVVIGTHGYYVDITPLSDRAREDLISARVAEIAEHRAIIEQAKGMLMLIYGLDDDAAFDLLRWRSQSSNVKLRLLAEKIVEDFRAVRDDGITSRSAFDHALLAADGGVGSGGDAEAASTAN
ncbi:MAG TPA: PAS and ANTAR domain-containing protein [Mycobacterium sp.]|nr:PAS and ANTAR domain-containing protein [Mycobacterium sp.]